MERKQPKGAVSRSNVFLCVLLKRLLHDFVSVFVCVCFLCGAPPSLYRRLSHCEERRAASFVLGTPLFSKNSSTYLTSENAN